MATIDRLDRARAAIPALFEVPVGVGIADPRAPQPELMVGEAAHVAKAVDSRQNEFAAGRAAARAAMRALGLREQPIPAHADRSPIWPSGMTGSISHKDTLCAAVVTTAPVTVGLDVEENTDLDLALLPSICLETEIEATAGRNQAQLAKLIFSAKEAAYKAQYPVTKKLFGFDHMEIALDCTTQSFTATYVKAVGPFKVGHRLPGRFDCVAGHIVTAVTLAKDG